MIVPAGPTKKGLLLSSHRERQGLAKTTPLPIICVLRLCVRLVHPLRRRWPVVSHQVLFCFVFPAIASCTSRARYGRVSPMAAPTSSQEQSTRQCTSMPDTRSRPSKVRPLVFQLSCGGRCSRYMHTYALNTTGGLFCLYESPWGYRLKSYTSVAALNCKLVHS